jgi:hypothetical protein
VHQGSRRHPFCTPCLGGPSCPKRLPWACQESSDREEWEPFAVSLKLVGPGLAARGRGQWAAASHPHHLICYSSPWRSKRQSVRKGTSEASVAVTLSAHELRRHFKHGIFCRTPAQRREAPLAHIVHCTAPSCASRSMRPLLPFLVSPPVLFYFRVDLAILYPTPSL